jgi:hypothetical protein
MNQLIVAALLAIGLAGCSGADDAGDVFESTGEESTIAYGYFGSIQIARGSSIDTTIEKLGSSDDIDVARVPDGVTVSISDSDDGTTHLEVRISDDAPTGAQVIIFEIAGEPEPVDWTIQIT